MRPVPENFLIGLFLSGQGEFEERDEQFHQKIAFFDIRLLLEKIADVIPDAGAFQNRISRRRLSASWKISMNLSGRNPGSVCISSSRFRNLKKTQ